MKISKKIDFYILKIILNELDELRKVNEPHYVSFEFTQDCINNGETKYVDSSDVYFNMNQFVQPWYLKNLNKSMDIKKFLNSLDILENQKKKTYIVHGMEIPEQIFNMYNTSKKKAKKKKKCSKINTNEHLYDQPSTHSDVPLNNQLKNNLQKKSQNNIYNRDENRQAKNCKYLKKTNTLLNNEHINNMVSNLDNTKTKDINKNKNINESVKKASIKNYNKNVKNNNKKCDNTNDNKNDNKCEKTTKDYEAKQVNKTLKKNANSPNNSKGKKRTGFYDLEIDGVISSFEARKGVYYDKSRKLWRANWKENGKIQTKGFSVNGNNIMKYMYKL